VTRVETVNLICMLSLGPTIIGQDNDASCIANCADRRDSPSVVHFFFFFFFFFLALNFLVESFGLLNDLFPFPSILDAGYPVFDLHLANVLFVVILLSVFGSSL